MLTCLEGFDLSTLMLASLADKLTKAVEALSSVLVKIQPKDKTQVIQSADMVRDRSFLALRTALESLAHRRDAATVQQAMLLLDIFHQHGWDLHNRSYATESSRMVDLLNDLESRAELTAAITSLKLSDVVAELKLAQQEFEAAYQDRTLVSAAMLTATGKEASKEVVATSTALFQAIDSLYTVTHTEDYLTIANRINEVVDSYTQVIRARITRAADSPKEQVDNG